MISTVALANTRSQNHHFVFLVRTFKNIKSLGNFEVYNTVLLTIITRLFISSPKLIHVPVASLYPMTNISPTPILRPGFPG